MSTIASGASAQISLEAGYTIQLSGGPCAVTPSKISGATTPVVIGPGAGSVGPYAEDRAVNLQSKGGAVEYSVQARYLASPLILTRAADIAAPTAAMLADTLATYQAVEDGTRYQSNGSTLVLLGSSAGSGVTVTVRIATTSSGTIASGLNDGDLIDGVNVATGDLVLVKDQASPAQNGIYVVGATPDRHSSFDAYDDYPGVLAAVQEGAANADTLWLCTSDKGGTLGSTAITFTKQILASTAISDATAAGRTLLTAADAAAQRTALALVPGTDVQAYDVELAAIAGLTSAADKVPYFTGSGSAAVADFTAAGRSMVAAANAAAQRTLLAQKDQQLAANFAGVDVTCTSAATNYQAFELSLVGLIETHMRIGVKVSYSWTGLTAATKTMLAGFGRTFADAMTGGTSSPDGRVCLSRTNGAAANEADFTFFVDIGASQDSQRLVQTSSGDENTSTSSAPPTGAVTLSANDCKLYLGVKSDNAGDIIHIDGIEVWKTRAL